MLTSSLIVETAIPLTTYIRKYGKQLHSLGYFYWEYSNVIQEGGGDQVLRFWRYLLSIFKHSGSKNYALEALRLLNQYEHRLMPRKSAQLAWNRFISVHGLLGRNSLCDPHQEHLNRVCKTSIAGLEVNKSKAAVVCIDKALGTLFPVLQQFDEHRNSSHIYLSERKGCYHSTMITEVKGFLFNPTSCTPHLSSPKR